MEKTIWLAIVAGGVLSVLAGVSAVDSLSHGISSFLADIPDIPTEKPTPADKAIWNLAGAWS